MRIGPDGDPVLDFENLTRDQAAALQEVTVETYMEGCREPPALPCCRIRSRRMSIP